MSEMSSASSKVKSRPLGSMVSIDPESLPLGTSPAFQFRYFDISSVANGRLQMPDTLTSYAEAPSRARRIVRNGDVLMSSVRPNLKAFAYCELPEGNYIASTGFAVLRAIDGNDPRYILYSILSDDVTRQIESHVVGSNYPAINSSDIKRLRIPDWKQPQQRRIAEILATVDEAIEQTEALVQKWQQMKAGLMHDLFTRGVTAAGQLRPTRQAAPQLYKQSPLGWIPKEWEVQKFSDAIATSFLGVTTRGMRNSSETIPLLKMGNLGWGELHLSEVEMLARALVLEERQFLRSGDFLFNTRNTPELVGKTAVYRGEFERCTCDNNLLCVRFKAGIDSRFVCQYLSHGIGKQRVFTMATGTTSVAAIYWSALSKFLLPLPKSPDEAKVIADRVDATSNLIADEQNNVAKLRAQKQGLMQDMLTGRVPVRCQE